MAAQQIFRLEQAMCSRRHWNFEHFETFLVQHPLIRHLTQRLVWAYYLMEPDAKGNISNYGGTPAGFFRVSEDGSFTDAADNPTELPAADNLRLGIPHIMEMPPEVQAEFGQLFADYELIQPFPQLGREIFSLRDDEKDGTALSRWSDIQITVGHVFGLGHRGWRRGTPQDGGWVGWMYKNLGQGIYAMADLDEGFGIGWTEMSEPQKIAGIQIGPMKEQWESIENPMALKDVDPIIISELIRQMEILTKRADA